MGKASSAAATRAATTTTSTVSSSSSNAAVAAAEVINMKRKKKKGRPSLLDLQRRQQQQQQQQQNNKTLTPPPPPSSAVPLPNSTPPRRSTRRNPLNYSNSPSSESLLQHQGDFDDDDDDEREQKKVKLVGRLPQSSSQPPGHHFRDSISQNSAASGSDSDADDHPSSSPKKRKINARSKDAVLDQGEKTPKVTGTVHGSPLESGPTTPLPDKTMLVFVLDRLQKKDTYGVFSEPVDPNELPDYHEIIEHPMDFGTVRKKLDGGVYLNLEQLEADVMLICSNAMQYNAPDTIYFRQARSIQELAKRDFENLRNEGDNGEPQPKVVRRGRPPSKNLKKTVESSPADHVVHEPSSVATLASGEDKANGSNGYNLRKGPAIYRLHSNDSYGTSHRTRNGENYSDWLVDWNSEFPASILRADMKYGKKHFSVDENRRDTYKQFQPSPSSSEQSLVSDALGDMKHLLAVGLHLEPHAYARSLARYAANIGPVSWNVASRKLRSALPDGLAFGPGWVEENDTSTQPFFSAEKLKPLNGLVCDHGLSRPANASSTPDFSSAVVHRPSGEMAETSRRLNRQNELADQGGALCWTTPGTSSQGPQKSVCFNGMFGSQIGIARLATPAGQSGLEESSIAGNQMQSMLSAGCASYLRSNPSYLANSGERIASENWGASSQCGNVLGQGPESHVTSEIEKSSRTLASPPPHVLPAQHRQPPLGVPPDLNIRVPATGSPSSSLQIGSPQPDLALQL